MGRQRLRRFLFLDGDLTNDFLSQLEGGTYEHVRYTPMLWMGVRTKTAYLPG
jgi:hypothetical protein